MSLEEFFDFTKDIRLTRRSVMMMWDAMDFDCDGTVTVTEFARAMNNLTSDQEVEKIFEHFDVNGDAELKREEFLRYFDVDATHKDAKRVNIYFLNFSERELFSNLLYVFLITIIYRTDDFCSFDFFLNALRNMVQFMRSL